MLMPRMRSIICRNERSPICDSAIEWHSDRVTFHTQTHRAIVTQAQPSPLWFSPLLSDLARQLAPEYWSALSTAAKERYRASQAKPSQATVYTYIGKQCSTVTVLPIPRAAQAAFMHTCANQHAGVQCAREH